MIRFLVRRRERPLSHEVPSTTAALRSSPRSFARLVGEPLKAALNSGCVMPRISRASVRGSSLPNTSRGAYGEWSGSSRANRTLRGHTSRDVWRDDRFEIRLETGDRTLATGKRR